MTRNICHTLTISCVLLLVSYVQAKTVSAQAVANPALRRELLQRVAQDQAIRNELIKKGMEKPDQAVLARITAIDTANTKRMKTIIRRYGWPSPRLVGQDGTARQPCFSKAGAAARGESL